MDRNSAIYEQNLQALEKCRPALFERVKNIAEDKSLEIVPSSSGLPSLKINNIHLHSIYNPLKEIEYYIEGAMCSGIETVVFLGTGLGYHIKHLWQNPEFKSRIIIVEKNPAIFKAALTCIDFTGIMQNMENLVFLDESIEDIIRICDNEKVFAINMLNLKSIFHPPSFRINQRYYMDILKKITAHLGACRSTFSTMNFFQDIWYKNGIENLIDQVSLPGISSLYNIVNNVPAVVVSAGPSLNKAIDFLKGIKGKIPIFSVGTTYKLLVNKGVVPDFVGALDADELVSKQFENINNNNVYFFAGDVLSKKFIEMFKPRVFTFYSQNNPYSCFMPPSQRNKGNTFSGGSISHAMVDIALKMGFNPIIFVGQDLCYDGEQTYAQGTMWDWQKINFADENDMYNKGYLYVKGNYENRVLTCHRFKIFVDNFERLINKYSRHEFVNVNDGGVYIPGTKVISLEEARHKYAGIQISTDELYPKIDAILKQFKPEWNEFDNELNRGLKGLRRIHKQLKKGYRKAKYLCDLVEDEMIYEKKKSIKIVAQDLDALNVQIEKDPWMRVVSFGPGGVKYLKLDMELKCIENKLYILKKVCVRAHEIYKDFLETAEYLIAQIKIIRKRKKEWTI